MMKNHTPAEPASRRQRHKPESDPTASIRPPDTHNFSETDWNFIHAARVPPTIALGEFGGLWRVERVDCSRPELAMLAGFPNYTLLTHWTEKTLHKDRGEVVMEDALRELSRHLPIWREASGRVLVTGLGMGCVVRALLTKPAVARIDVVERDRHILGHFGPEFAPNPRVRLHHADAFKFRIGGVWDFAAHDIWHPTKPVPVLHAKLIAKYYDNCRKQTAWGMPDEFHQKIGGYFVVNPNI